MVTLTAVPTLSVLPGPGLIVITRPFFTVFEVACLIFPSLQSSAGITSLAIDSVTPASFTVLQVVVGAGVFTVSVALAELFAGFGSCSVEDTDAASAKLPALAAETMTRIGALEPGCRPLIVQLT